MTVHAIDPLTDPRWRRFINDHPRASIFHSTGWLDALRQTYRYTPRVLTTTPLGEALRNGLAVCEVRGWRRTRLVSLPFSDHCEPLVDTPQEWSDILAFLSAGIGAGRWTSVELRPRTGALMTSAPGTWSRSHEYLFHRCDLTPGLDDIYARLHPSCIQRPIRRAERERLHCESGSSAALLDTFYRLLRMTRRRQGLPPQPIAWFRNLAAALRDRLTVHVALKAGRPIASILTISFKSRLVYKYGCSDAAYHRLGGMPFLFWQAMQDAKARGFEELDLGRSDADQRGLTDFKDRLGAERTTLTYYSRPAAAGRDVSGWQERAARWAFERLPDPALTLAGRILYKHFA
jgi:CelD/BcsL family acetyltransferase involved in cellulose biosynthesis